MKKIIYISAWVLTLAAIFITLGFVSRDQENMTCKGLVVAVDYNNDNYFINKDEVAAIINKNGNIVNRTMNGIDIPAMEKLLNNHPFVSNAEVFKTMNGELHATIKQRNPAIRIFNSVNQSFYLDEDGYFMPLSSNYTAKILVATGYINSTYISIPRFNISTLTNDSAYASRSMLDDLFKLAQFINKDKFWRAQIQQIYVTEKNEIELIPTVGDHKIILGDINNMEEKFEKLIIFYRKALNKTGWDAYQSINLKFNNQVVCTKK